MSKGGKTSTNTVVQNTTPWNSSQLSDLYSSAKDAYTNSPVTYYPNDTLYVDPSLSSAYSSLVNTGLSITNGNGGILDAGNNSIINALNNNSMSGYYSPAYSGLSDISKGTTSAQSDVGANADTLSYLGGGEGKYHNYLTSIAGGVITNNPANDYLSGIATGDYWNDNPSDSYYSDVLGGKYLNSNPYLDDMYDSAADAVTRAYQTATAPDTESKYETAGRYGSGVMTNEKTQNRLDLGESLDKLSSDIYGKNYENERSLQNTAASDYGGLYSKAADRGLSAAKEYGQQYLTGASAVTDAAKAGLDSEVDALKDAGTLSTNTTAGQLSALDKLQTGYDTGNQNTLKALALVPSQIEANFTGPEEAVTGAKGLTSIGQADIQDAMDRYYGDAMVPWTNLQMYSELLGNPTSTGTSTTKSPVYSNTASSLLGTGLGITGLLGSTGAFGSGGYLTGSSGLLSGLFGSGASDSALTSALDYSFPLAFGGI